MTRDELNKLLATYIVAIGEKGIPNSHLWLAVDRNMSDLTQHQLILGSLKQQDIVREQFNYITLTEKGLGLHEKIKALVLDKPPVTT